METNKINDNRPITVEFLKKNFDDNTLKGNQFSTTKEQTPISVDVFAIEDLNRWKVIIYPDNVVYINTVAQLKAFLRMFGLDEFANNLKG